ncbi:MAG: DUF899 domain-containing protein [Cyanobacteria bacterium P01_F01_bin.86]
MTTETVAHPQVVSKETWLAERQALLDAEKALTQHIDRVNTKRRRLPMVKVDKAYIFEGPDGKTSLLDLFGDHRQLIVYHFMFAPDWEKGCAGCTGLMNAMGDLSMLDERDTTLVLISRAPLEKLERHKAQHRWELPWVSSFGSDFNYDFQATLDESVTPVAYNYRPASMQGEKHGMSVFFRLNDAIFHTYSTYARGCEALTDAYRLLDITPYGRQEDFEDSPSGWPQKPTYG